MRDDECVQFLQWVLPQLHMRWPGFRKVHAQVCKRIRRRLKQLTIDGFTDYRYYLETHNDEWKTLDALCRVTVSRFYRDKQMFIFLEQTVLPNMARQAIARGDECLKIWCVGSGSGEEPYTIAIIWKLILQKQFPNLRLQVIASDANPDMKQRAQAACYEYGSIKNLPETWREKVFIRQDALFCLKLEYQHDVQFIVQDVREVLLADEFDLVLCRNLIFTYFDEPLQRKLLERIMRVLKPEGTLVIGIHENLPENLEGLRVWSERLRIFQNE